MFQVFSHKLRRKVEVVTLKISLLVDLETPVATVCGLIAQVTANDRCSHEEVRQSPAFFFCEQPDFMLHMSRVFEQQDTANRVGRHAEKLQSVACSSSSNSWLWLLRPALSFKLTGCQKNKEHESSLCFYKCIFAEV